jgi:transcriptional regulator with XRE-family HTH domain
MKSDLPQVGSRIRALRRSLRWTQEFLAGECQKNGIPISRYQLTRYEIGFTEIPASFIPVLAYILKADITALLPPVTSQLMPVTHRIKIKNCSGQQIQAFRKKRKWSQKQLAIAMRNMGVPITREIIAGIESRRHCVKDFQLFFFAKALQCPLHSLFPA